MKTQIKKWGNSLALRIPKIYVDEMAFGPDSIVEISVIQGNLVVVPIYQQEYTLESLLENITEDNLHHEIETGTAVGNEAW